MDSVSLQELLDKQKHLVEETKEEFERVRQELQAHKRRQADLELQLREALRAEAIAKAEKAKQDALAPDFNNPELVALLRTLEELPTYAKLRPFQKQDLIIFFDRYLKGVKGFINANDMGLGKTAQLAFFLQTLEHRNSQNKEAVGNNGTLYP